MYEDHNHEAKKRTCKKALKRLWRVSTVETQAVMSKLPKIPQTKTRHTFANIIIKVIGILSNSVHFTGKAIQF